MNVHMKGDGRSHVSTSSRLPRVRTLVPAVAGDLLMTRHGSSYENGYAADEG